VEVLTCYPGLHAIYIHKLSHWLWRSGLRWLGRFVSQLGRWLTGIEIPSRAKIGNCVFIDHGMGVVIGETAEVGDGCTIYQGVTLGGTSLYRAPKRHPTWAAASWSEPGRRSWADLPSATARASVQCRGRQGSPRGRHGVGIPGRIVEESHVDYAARFAAYGVVHSEDDPHAKAIQTLVEYSKQLEQSIASLKERLSGSSVPRPRD